MSAATVTLPDHWRTLFGRRLRAARTTRNLTLAAAADLTGMAAVVIGSYERGNRSPSIDRLRQIADGYGVTVASLVPNLNPWIEAVHGGAR